MADNLPLAPPRSDTEVSSDLGTEQEPDPNPRSRSQSRRRRRQKQQKTQQSSAQAGALTSVKEEPGQQEGQRAQASAQASAQAPNSMQPFDLMGGGGEDPMDGPIAYTRAEREPVAMRDSKTAQQSRDATRKDSDEDDGLKLRLDLNIDIEIELKASIRGDLTLALFE